VEEKMIFISQSSWHNRYFDCRKMDWWWSDLGTDVGTDV